MPPYVYSPVHSRSDSDVDLEAAHLDLALPNLASVPTVGKVSLASAKLGVLQRVLLVNVVVVALLLAAPLLGPGQRAVHCAGPAAALTLVAGPAPLAGPAAVGDESARL